MAAKMLALLVGILFFCCTQSAMADVPTPQTWPVRFHAFLVQNFSGELGVMDLWYDWEKGGNLHIIQPQLSTPTYDMEWTNGTSFFWDEESKTCTSAQVGVGILRPDWLVDADYLGVREMSGFTCNVWNKLDFITYYEDVESKRPVYWFFYTGRQVHVITFDAGAVLDDEQWQAPEYCFQEGDTTLHDNGVFHPKRMSTVSTEYKEWLLSGAVSA
ncbi:unnamed protein product [Calypogeia fissa]